MCCPIQFLSYKLIINNIEIFRTKIMIIVGLNYQNIKQNHDLLHIIIDHVENESFSVDIKIYNNNKKLPYQYNSNINTLLSVFYHCV